MRKQLNVNYVFIDEDENPKLKYFISNANTIIPVKFDSVPELVAFQKSGEQHVFFLKNRMYFQARQRAFYLHYGFLNDDLCVIAVEELFGSSYKTVIIAFIEKDDSIIKITVYGKDGSEDLLLFYVTDTILFDEVGVITKPESASYVELFLSFPHKEENEQKV